MRWLLGRPQQLARLPSLSIYNSRYTISYHITSHHITSYHIISHHITSYHITSYHITSYHITSHHITSYHITSHHITSYHTISYHIISYHIISYISYISYIIYYIGVILLPVAITRKAKKWLAQALGAFPEPHGVPLFPALRRDRPGSSTLCRRVPDFPGLSAAFGRRRLASGRLQSPKTNHGSYKINENHLLIGENQLNYIELKREA